MYDWVDGVDEVDRMDREPLIPKHGDDLRPTGRYNKLMPLDKENTYMVESCAAGEIHCALCGGAQIHSYDQVFDVKRRRDKTRYSLCQCADCTFVFLDPRQLSGEQDYYGEKYYSYSTHWHKKIDQWR